MTTLIGIVNITTDSFSDANRYIEKDKAINKARSLFKEAASIIDLGAQSTNPNGKIISAKEELRRLTPVIKELQKDNIPLSIDSYKAAVIKDVLQYKVDMINDVTALSSIDAELIDYFKQYKETKIVLMHSVHNEHNAKGKASKVEWNSSSFIQDIITFFNKKLDYLTKKGLSEKRFILDPGMGFFLSTNPKASLSVLNNIDKLKTCFKANKIYISVSRKSFIGTVLQKPRVNQRQAGTLAAEIQAFIKGVDYIRTHDTGALMDAIKLTKAIMEA